jgi:hypothetical protein
MTDFLEKWKGYKDKALLQEFNRLDKEDIIENGDNFSISYELEMISEDRIDPETGDILEEGENYNGWTDVAALSSRDQAQFFGMEDSIYDSAADGSAMELYDNFIEVQSSESYKISKHLAAIIGLVLTKGDSSDDIIINDFNISSFCIASFLSKGENKEAKQFLINYSLTPESRQSFLRKISEFNSGLDYEPYKIKQHIDVDNYTPEIFKEFIGNIFGLEGENWEITSSQEILNREELNGRFIEFLLGKKIIKEEIKEFESLCQEIYHYSANPRIVRLSELRDASVWRRTLSGTTPPGVFDSFYKGVLYLASAADKLIDSIYDASLEEFDYTNYSFDLNDFEAYDSNNGGFFGDNDYEKTGENSFEKYLPNMWAEYGDIMEGTSDGSLPDGYHTELKFTGYLLGMDNALTFLDTFFSDFNNQKNFSFSKATGLHTNIGMELPYKKFNTFKALLFLGEEEDPRKKDKTPFAYKGIESRYLDKRWSSPRKSLTFDFIRNRLLRSDEKYDLDLKETLKTAYKEQDFSVLNAVLTSYVNLHTNYLGVKKYGLNLHYINDRGYIEFRYPGHKVSAETLKNLTLYYGHIVRCALDPEYKKEEYIKKLYSFVGDLLAPTKEKYVQKANLPKLSKLMQKISNRYDSIMNEQMERIESVMHNSIYFVEEQIGTAIYERICKEYPDRYSFNNSKKYEFFGRAEKIQGVKYIFSINPDLKKDIVESVSRLSGPVAKVAGSKLKEKVNTSSEEFTGWIGINYKIASVLNFSTEISAGMFPDSLQSRWRKTITDKLYDTFIEYFREHQEEFPERLGVPTPSNISETWFEKYKKQLG